MAFEALSQILAICQKESIDFAEAVLREDSKDRLVDREASIRQMTAMWESMCDASDSYDVSRKSNSGLVGGAGGVMADYVAAGNTLCGDAMGRVIAQALQMGESNACMKRIVAAPTAGACGVLPAVLIPLFRDDPNTIRALFVAAGIGQVIATRASIAGASGGCQAEIGSASAMAAGALVYLRGGSCEQILAAVAMSLKNLLGLVCDPVSGLVEVPCVKRNVIGAVNAMSAADMALAGIQSMIPADQVIDASRMVVYPGLINTHHHLYQLFSRNLPEVQRMELFPWLVTLYDVWKNLDEEVVAASSLVGMAELLKTGCTTCFDHHYVFPARAGDLIGAQFRAAELVGMRFHASRGSMDLSRKDGGLPPDSVVQTIDQILADSERLVRVWHDPSRFSMRQVALAPCSPFSVSTDLLRESARLARSLEVRLHTHVAETRDEEQYTLERFGLRPLAYLEGLGWTGPDVWYAHGIHFNDDELKALAATGTGVAHCPISNMKLSSGVCRVPEMLRLGVPVGLAVDGAASNDGSNLLEELRVCYLLHRLQSSQSAPTGYDILKLATRGSARLLGRDDIGCLAAGMAADCFLISLDRIELAGAQFDPLSLLGTVGLKGPVDYTIVNGMAVVQNGELVTADEGELAARANAAVCRYLGRC